MDELSGEIEIVTDPTKEEWYLALVEECKAIITEAVFNSRWALVEGYHQLGERIVTDTNLERENIYGEKIVQGLAQSLGISKRTVWYAIQFYEKYPSLSVVPEGKNITWNKIITKYLPEPKKETPQLPDGKYQVIYADPPWRYDFSLSDSRMIENQYPTMEVEEICSLSVDTIAADDCVLLMWATNPKLREAFQVLDAWGFEYKTNMVWIKDKIGMGYYARQQHELLLIATRGNLPVPEPANRPSSIISGDRVEHSKKPEDTYSIIEKMYPERNKIELFARSKRVGWDVWGNEF